MLLKLFLFFCSLNAEDFDGDCDKYKQFVELDGVEIANTDELGIFRIESDRSECSKKCVETDLCLGLFHFLCQANNPCHNHLLNHIKAYSYNIEQKLCFLKGDSVGQINNTEYASGKFSN